MQKKKSTTSTAPEMLTGTLPSTSLRLKRDITVTVHYEILQAIHYRRSLEAVPLLCA